jgi:glutamate-1-semialdehyde 2,1-aminomutase
MFGENTESEIQLAEMVTQCVPCAESVRILNTGSDATAAAIRLARTRTRRDKIVKFSGGYHGWHDWGQVDLSVSNLGHTAGGERPLRTITTEGIPESAVEEVIVIPWNDLEEAERIVKRWGHEIAAIITEPYMCNYGVIPPKKGYLKGLRELTQENDIVLIFDEVITGFRFGLGGAQQMVGVTPDIATFAKAMANGFPVAMIAGNKETMEPAANRRTWLAGTYSANNISTAAAIATIDQLKQNSGQIYRKIYDVGDKMIKGIGEAAEDLGIDVVVSGVAPAFSIFFTDLDEVSSAYQVNKYLDKKMASKFVLAMMKRGVFIFPTANLRTYMGASHTQDDAERFVQACRESLKEARDMRP